MALRRISHKRLEEQVNRNFDIISNDKTQGGVARATQNEFMNQPEKPWNIVSAADKKVEKVSDKTAGVAG